MADYTFTRTRLNGHWDIRNPARVDQEGNQIYLAKEIETALPGKSFRVVCEGTNCTVKFDATLTDAEETTLTNTVNAHKNNT